MAVYIISACLLCWLCNTKHLIWNKTITLVTNDCCVVTAFDSVLSNQLPWSSSDWTLNVNHIQLCQSMLCSSTLDVSLSGDLPPSAVATCVQNMSQLRTLVIFQVDPVPVFQATTCRVSPLQIVDVLSPPWVYTVYTYSYAASLLVA